MMVLVTGGNGFLGSYLLCDLLRKGLKVRALLRSGSSLKGFEDIASIQLGAEKDRYLQNLLWAEGDISDIYSLEDAMKGITQVYHCAALVSFQARDRDALFRVNAEGTANVVNACLDAGIQKLCYVSSVAALGRMPGNKDISEDTDWTDSKENSNYAVSKHLGEMEVWRGIEEGLPSVIVNPGIILGFGEWESGSCELFRQAYKGLPAVTEGMNGYVDVRDVSRIMIQLMDSDVQGQRFVIVAENKSYKDIFGMAAECFGKQPAKLIATPWMAGLAWRLLWPATLFGKKCSLHAKRREAARAGYRYDNSRIRKQLGYEFIRTAQTISDACKTFKKKKTLTS